MLIHTCYAVLDLLGFSAEPKNRQMIGLLPGGSRGRPYGRRRRSAGVGCRPILIGNLIGRLLIDGESFALFPCRFDIVLVFLVTLVVHFGRM